MWLSEGSWDEEIILSKALIIIIWVAPKCHTCLRERLYPHTEEKTMQRQEDQYDAATSQEILTATLNQKSQGKDSPQSLQRERGPDNVLISSEWTWLSMFGLQNCERINFSCLKPSILWWFVTAAAGNEYTTLHTSVKCIENLANQSCKKQTSFNLYRFFGPFSILLTCQKAEKAC